MYGREYFLCEGRACGDAPSDSGMPARDHAQRAAGNWRVGGRSGGGADSAARRIYTRPTKFSLSSTNRSMLGVSEINGHQIAAAPGPVTLKLEKAFGAFVRQYLEAHSAAARQR